MENENTNLPFKQILEQENQEWNKFRRALRMEDQEVFGQLFEKARLHVGVRVMPQGPGLLR